MGSQCKVGRGSQREVEGKVEGKMVAELAWYSLHLDLFIWTSNLKTSAIINSKN